MTAVLMVTAAGEKLPTLFIKRGTTPACISKLRTTPASALGYSADGWMNGDVMKMIIDSWHARAVARPGIHNGHCALILDQYSAHKSQEVVDYAESKDVYLIFVPVGTTSHRQPLDVSVNGPIKSLARRRWRERMQANPAARLTLQDAINEFEAAYATVTSATVRGGFVRALGAAFA